MTTDPCVCIDYQHAPQAHHDGHCCLRDGTGNARDEWCHVAEWEAVL